MLGVMSPFEALREAEKRGLDLVEISPKASPPVCKIMDFGKFKYEQKKKTQGQKKQHGSVIKEIVLSPATDTHDLDFKMKHCIRFLEEGYRVKVMVRFRGREMAHPEIGHKQMQKVLEALASYGAPEVAPKMEGKILAALFAPATGAVKAKPAASAKEAAAAPKPQVAARPMSEAKRS